MLSQLLSVEPLESRRLLSADVEIGSIDNISSYSRTVAGITATYAPTVASAQIGASMLSNDLLSGLNVIVVTATGAAAQPGDIIVSSNIIKNAPGVLDLVLRADRDILVSSVISNTANAIGVSGLNVVLNSDRDANGDGRIEVTSTGIIFSRDGNITMGGGLDPTTTAAVGRAGVPQGVFLNQSRVTTNNGNVLINGRGAAGSDGNATGVLLRGATNGYGLPDGPLSSDLGSITITGTAGASTGSDSDGVRIDFAQLTVQNADLTITGNAGGSSLGNDGVQVSNMSTVDVAQIGGAMGSLTITGTSLNSSGNDSRGILIDNSTVSVGAAPMSLVGRSSSATGTQGINGIEISAANISSGGTTVFDVVGNVTIDGASDASAGSGDGVSIYTNSFVETNDAAFRIIGNTNAANSSGVSIFGTSSVLTPEFNVTAISITGDATGSTSSGVTIGDATIGGDSSSVNIMGTSTSLNGVNLSGTIRGSVVDIQGSSASTQYEAGVLVQNTATVQVTNLTLVGENLTAQGVGVSFLGGQVTALTIDLLANGSMAIQDAFLSGDDSLSLHTTDTALTSESVAINGTAVLSSSAGDVMIRSGDNLNIASTVSISGSNFVASVDDAASDPDPGVGGSVDILASLTFTGTINLNGGVDSDTFRPIIGLTTSIDGGGTTDNDILLIDGAGGFVTITSTQVSITNSGTTINVVNLEELQIANATRITFEGDSSNDTFTLSAVPTTTNTSLMFANGLRATFNAVTPVFINGNDGDDTLVFDVSNGGARPNVTFNGGANVGAIPGDQIIVQGTPPTPIDRIDFFQQNTTSGGFGVGTAAATYTDVESFSSLVEALNLSLQASVSNSTISVSQTGSSIRSVVPGGILATFVVPTAELLINTDIFFSAESTINVGTLNGAFSLTIRGNFSPGDTVNFNGPVTSTAGGILVTAPIVNFNAPIVVSGGLEVDDFSGTGTTTFNTTSITTGGRQLYFGPVQIDNDVTLVSLTNQVDFQTTVDGAHNLTIESLFPSRFQGAVGGTIPLASLSVGPVQLFRAITTTGPQLYNNAVELLSNVTLTSANDAITFNSSLNSGGSGFFRLTTSSGGITSFAGPIGDNRPLVSLMTTTGGPFVAPANLSTLDFLDFITFEVTDTAAAGDDLIVPAGATLNARTVTLIAGDNVVIEAEATINVSAGQLTIITDSPAVDPDPGFGSTVSVLGTISTTAGTTINSGPDSDSISLLPQSGTAFSVVGGGSTANPGDELILDAGGLDVVFDVASSSFVFPGAQNISDTGVDRIRLDNVNVLTINGVNTFDLVKISKDPDVAGGDLIQINGRTPIAINGASGLVFNGLGGDDFLDYDATLGAISTPVTYNGGQQDGTTDGDFLRITGSFTTQTFNYLAPGADGFNGNVDLDGTVINYTGLEPISSGNSTDTILNFNTGAANNATLRNNSSVGLIEIIDNGATFERTSFANPTNSLTINLGAQGDTLLVNTLDAAFAASIIVNGGAGIDTVGFEQVILSSTPGRGLDVASVETLTINRSTFSNNTADVGGGLRVVGGSTTISNSSFISNIANSDVGGEGGGAIFQDGGDLVITGETTVIRGNQATGRSGSGGGILSRGGSLSISDATIRQNEAALMGGGVLVSGVSSSLRLNNVNIDNNSAGDSGGGVYVDEAALTIVNSTIQNNLALGTGGSGGSGGGLYILGSNSSLPFSVSNSTVNNNRSLGGGGGAFIVEASGTITGGDILNNQVTGNGTTFETGGGGLVIVGGTLTPTVTLSAVNVDGNTAPAAGGIAVIDALVTLQNVSISNNMATESQSGGGGIGAVASSSIAGNLLTVTGSTITANTTTGEGGGIGVVGANVSISTSTINGNRANGGRGGGIGLLNAGIAGTATLRQTTIAGNTASVSGGGIASLNMGIDLENVTISGNSAATVGGGIAYDNNVATVGKQIRFSTFTSNIAAGGGSNVAATGSPIDVTASIFNNGTVVAAGGALRSLGNNLDSGNTTGFSQPTDRLNTDPRLGPLQDNGGVVFTHSLFRGSPAIDAGPATGPAIDARGSARPIDGDGNGLARFDIGAFEGELAFAVFVDDVTVNEGVGTATVTVRLPNAFPGGFTINFSTADGTAVQPGDYTTSSGTLTFTGTAGEVRTFTIPIIDDSVVESPETVLIRLSNPSNPAIIATDTAVLTITDNDSAPISADLSTSIIGTPASVVSGNNVIYTVTVNNVGPDAAGNVFSRTTLPAGLTFVSATASGVTPTFSSGVITANFATLANNNSVTVTITARATAATATTVNVTTNVTSAATDPIATNNSGSVTTSITPSVPVTADLSTSISGTPAGVVSGNNVVYTVTVNNAGPATANNVVSRTTLPAGLTIISVTTSNEVLPFFNFGVVTANFATLANAGTVTVTITARATAATATTVNVTTNVTSAATDSNAANNTGSVSTTISPTTLGRIDGHVFCDSNGNNREDALEAIGGVTVYLDRNGNRILDANEANTQTNDSGDFRFDNVVGGAVTVAVIVPSSCNTIPRQVGVDRTSLEAGNLARSITTVDIDGDSDLDLLIASDLSNSLTIFENNHGVFSLRETVSLGDRPQAVAAWKSPLVGSMASVAVVGIGTPSNRGTVFKLTDGNLESFKAGNGPIAVVLDDFNGDGLADVLTAASRQSSVVTLTLGKQPTSSDPGTIGASFVLPDVRNVRAIITGDFNGDGKVDVAIAGLGFAGDTASELKILLGRGDGTFASVVARSADREILDLVATDLDGDGHDELLALSGDGQILAYRFVNQSISLIGRTSVSQGATSFAIGDFNRDSITDVAVANLGDETIELLVGDKTGRFFSRSIIRNVTAPSDLVVADLDGDGISEIAVANFYRQLPEFPDASTPRNQLPSTLTILKLNVAEQAIMVSSNSSTSVTIAFPQARPETLLDVNLDSKITAADALDVISAMRESEIHSLVSAAGEQFPNPTSRTVISRAPKRSLADVNGDGRVSALDALMVINSLNQQQLALISAASGEDFITHSSASDLSKIQSDEIGLDNEKRASAFDAVWADVEFSSRLF